MLALLAILLVAPDEEAVRTRASEAPVDLDAAWEEHGFRMQLGGGYEQTRRPSRSDDRWSAISVHIEPGARLSPRWSVSLPIEYAIAFRSPYDGIRWTTLAQLAWHPSTGSYLAVAAGYGGMIMSGQDESSGDFAGRRPAPGPGEESEPSESLGTSSTFVERRDCTGDGFVGQVRLGQLWHSGELFSTGPMLTAQAHWTHCAASGEGEDGVPLERGRWLTQLTFGASWMFAWR